MSLDREAPDSPRDLYLDQDKSISTRYIMCVRVCVYVRVCSCAKKLMVDLEIAYLPFYSLFKAIEIGELIKSYSFVSFHYFVSLLREQC